MKLRFPLYGSVAALIPLLGLTSALHSQDHGWVNQTLPPGVVRGPIRGEYLLKSTGETLVYVPAGPAQVPSPVMGPFGPELFFDIQILPAYYIGENDVSVKAFRSFVQAKDIQTQVEKTGKAMVPISGPALWGVVQGVSWKAPGFPQGDDYPAVLVSYDEAEEYCEWSGGRLPTRSEWLKASLWDDDQQQFRPFPWGKPGPLAFAPYTQPAPVQFVDGSKGNFMDAALLRARNMPGPPGVQLADDGYPYTSPVGHYPSGASFYGAKDMAGNVSQWTSDSVTPGIQGFMLREYGAGLRSGHLVMGSSFNVSARVPPMFPALTYIDPPDGGNASVGIRIVVPAP